MSQDKKSCQNCSKRRPQEKNPGICVPCHNYSLWQRNPNLWLDIPPTEPGWYWLKEKDRVTQIVEVIIKHSHVYRSGTECFDKLTEVEGQWQGPITPDE